jgi:hypothetical protein
LVNAAGRTSRSLATACAKISATPPRVPAAPPRIRIFRLEPRPRRPAAIGRVDPLRHDAQPYWTRGSLIRNDAPP